MTWDIKLQILGTYAARTTNIIQLGQSQTLPSEQRCKSRVEMERQSFHYQRRSYQRKTRFVMFGIDGLVGRSLYRTRHFLWLLLRLLRDKRAARVACSNTSRTPSLVLAEHSRYLYAPIFLRISSPYIENRICISKQEQARIHQSSMSRASIEKMPDAEMSSRGVIFTSSGVTGFWLVLRSSSTILPSYRKSFLQPTRMIGKPWQK